jgi:tRNA pseudouridine38-40 synthase
MRTLKLTLEYDGTDYVGWQRQPNGESIQGLLEQALEPIEGEPVTVHAAGRTDAGAHALGQVASVTLAATLDCARLGRALNAALPAAVRVLRVEEAAAEFHARFSAVAKTYEYRILNAPIVSPFLHRYVAHIVQPLQVAGMRDASASLLGRHDFSAFQAAGSDTASSVRTIHSIEWQNGGGGDSPIVMQITGDGFLRHMVRNIAGTLVQVGIGRWPISSVEDILNGRDRAQAGATAPAAGLFLVRVDYGSPAGHDLLYNAKRGEVPPP